MHNPFKSILDCSISAEHFRLLSRPRMHREGPVQSRRSNDWPGTMPKYSYSHRS